MRCNVGGAREILRACAGLRRVRSPHDSIRVCVPECGNAASRSQGLSMR